MDLLVLNPNTPAVADYTNTAMDILKTNTGIDFVNEIVRVLDIVVRTYLTSGFDPPPE